MLSIKNSHPRDSHIQFNEIDHIYTVDGNSNYKSVTTFIHDFFPKFDADNIINKMRKGKNWKPDNQYYFLSNDQIKSLWAQNGKDASTAGTLMHLNIENYYNNLPLTDGFIDTPEYKLFQNFLLDHSNFIPFRTEWQVFSKKYLLAGSIDMVFIDPLDDSKIIIADWKRCKEIKFNNKWEKGIGPLSDLDNCNFSHYTLQLNTYRMILEKYYQKSVSQMFLVVLHPDNNNYIKINIPRISTPIKKMLDTLFLNNLT